LKVTPQDYDFRDLRHYLLTKSNYAIADIPTRLYTCDGRHEHPPIIQKHPGKCPTGPLVPFYTQDQNRVMFRGDDFPILPKIILNNKEILNPEEDDEDQKNTVYQEFLTLPMNMLQSITIKKMMVTSTSSVATTSVQTARPAVGYLLYINTKPNALSWSNNDKITTSLDGYIEAREFYSPVYEKADNKVDVRSTVYWNPRIVTNEKGEATVTFFTSSYADKLLLTLEGQTANALLVEAAGMNSTAIQIAH
jgi:hypothetical protein